MFKFSVAYILRASLIAAAAASLGGCASSFFGAARETDERLCLARAMYFESNRSSDDGMLAVGTVVMNRLESRRYPRTICGVVGQARQFAPGVLTSPMDGVGRKRALKNADRVLAGARMPGMENVEFFHTAGLDYPYSNMQYRLVAGGNAFYEKRYARPGERQQTQLAAIARQQGQSPPLPPERLDIGAPDVEAVPLPPLPPDMQAGLAPGDGMLVDEQGFQDLY